MRFSLYLLLLTFLSGIQLFSIQDTEWEKQLGKYSDIYYLIQENYPGKTDRKKVVFNSITALLKSLDPHSYFFDPVTLRSVNEEQKGKYYGIGTKINKYGDNLTIIAPIKGTPADRLGLQSGDIIVKIDGKATASMSIDDAMSVLRGTEGSKVVLKIRRANIPTLLKFTIARAEIPLNTVSKGFVVPGTKKTGYVSIKSFGLTTAKEFEKEVTHLVANRKIDSLIIDLRENPGGALIAAVRISDLFLPKGKIIVSIKGRKNQETYTARQEGKFSVLKTAVLINRGSASASEIVASALQEHKKATILGTRSWGKGLVETVTRVSMNSAVALTTAKYYTPGGHCLQRNYNVLDDYYFFFNSDKYDCDLSVSGGVIPDILVKTSSYPLPVVKLISKGIFFEFSKSLITKHAGIDQNFKVSNKTVKEFLDFLEERKIKFHRKELERHKTTLRYEIRRDLFNTLFSETAGMKVFVEQDPVVKRAVKVLKKQ